MDESINVVQMGAGRTMRPATPADIKLIRAHICEAIDESPFYNAQFKAHEKARLNEDFLLALISSDPWFVPVIIYKGDFAGFIVSTPELGVLWAVWVYISPRFRQTAIDTMSCHAMPLRSISPTAITGSSAPSLTPSGSTTPKR